MNRAEFEQRALEHLDACYRLALQLTKHPDEASDLVQETYLRALKNVSGKFDADTIAQDGIPGPDGTTHSFKGFTESGGGIRSWLFTILHNTFYTRAGRKARGPGLSGELDSFAQADSTSPVDDAPPAWDLATFDWEHVDSRLKDAIDTLTPEHRQILLLWGVEGKKYREIAGIIGVPIGTVMSRLHRARAILAKSLEGFRQEIGWKKES